MYDGYKTGWNDIKVIGGYKSEKQIRLAENCVIYATRQINCNDTLPNIFGSAWKVILDEKHSCLKLTNILSQLGLSSGKQLSNNGAAQQ